LKFDIIKVYKLKDNAKTYEVTRAIHNTGLDIMGLQKRLRLGWNSRTSTNIDRR